MVKLFGSYCKKITKCKKITNLRKSLFLLGFVIIIINSIIINMIFNKVFGFIKYVIIILFLNTFSGDTITPGLNSDTKDFIEDNVDNDSIDDDKA